MLVGAVGGLALGVPAARYVEPLLDHVNVGDAGMLVLPSLTILAAALVVALPPVIRAIRIDPVKMLRVE